MSSYTLRVWQESYLLDDIIHCMRGTSLGEAFIQEMSRYLILRKYLKEYNIPEHNDAAYQDGLLNQFCKQKGLSSQKALEAWIKKTGTPVERLAQQLIHDDQIEQLKVKVISQSHINDLFLKRKSKLDSVLFSIIRVESDALAQELYHQLVDDERDFAMLAARYSTGKEAGHGGIIGPVPFKDLNMELRSHLIPLKPQDITEPFTLDGKVYMIIRLIRRDPAQLTAEKTKELRDELFEQWLARQLTLANTRLLQTQSSDIMEALL